MARFWITLLLALGLLGTPALADADSGWWRPWYRNSLGYWPASYYPYSYTTTVTSVPGVGMAGAPLHGIVCSRGMIAELPLERQAIYIDGATVGHPGYRCLNFR